MAALVARRLMPLVFALVLTLDAVTKSLTGYVDHAPGFGPVWVVVTAGVHLATLPLMSILLLLAAFVPWRAGGRRRRGRKYFGRRLPAL